MAPPKSNIWKYFTKLSDSLARCKECFKIIKHSGNTTNLIKHAKVHGTSIKKKTLNNNSINHTDDVADKSSKTTNSGITSNTEKKSDSNQAIDGSITPMTLHNSIEEVFARVSATHEGGAKFNKIVEAILFFICKDMRPFNVVQGEGFLKLMKEVAPLFKVPRANFFKKRLNEKYQVSKNKFKDKFNNVEWFCLTMDIWTETMNEKSYMGAIAHFLENNEMKMCYLATRPLNDRHTGEYISNILLNVLSEWEIPHCKVRAVVTDNASSMVAAVRASLGEQKHLPCFAHTINLVAEEALKLQSAKSIITKVRDIVKWVKNSVIQSDKLRKIQLRNNVAEGSVLKLILDVKTRWNSVFYMLERFLILKKVVSEIILETVGAPDMPNGLELEILTQLAELLKPLEYVTKEASGQKYITISKVIPMLSCLSTEITNFTTESTVVTEFKEILKKELKKRYGQVELNDHAALATILDPRFKNINFQDPTACGRAIH